LGFGIQWIPNSLPFARSSAEGVHSTSLNPQHHRGMSNQEEIPENSSHKGILEIRRCHGSHQQVVCSLPWARSSRNWGSHESGKVNYAKCSRVQGLGCSCQVKIPRNNQILGIRHHPHFVSLAWGQLILFWNLGRDCSFGRPKSPLMHRTTNFIQCKEHSARGCTQSLRVVNLMCAYAGWCGGSLCMCARVMNWSRAQSCKRMHITKNSFSNGDCDQLLAASKWAQEASTEHNNYSALK
jgi:hypothetical protein